MRYHLIDLILMVGLHVTEEQLASMIARTDTTGRGALHSRRLLFFVANSSLAHHPGEINMGDFLFLLSELEQIRDAQNMHDNC